MTEYFTVESALLAGVDAERVQVNVSFDPTAKPDPGPDGPIGEALARVQAAMLASNYPWPAGRVGVDWRFPNRTRFGAGLDLAIAVGVLVHTGELDRDMVEGLGFVGELAPDGSLRAVRGMVSLVDALAVPAAVVPVAARVEAAVGGRHTIHTAYELREVVDAITQRATWLSPPETSTIRRLLAQPVDDLAGLRGGALAQCAVEVAAAGGHHLLVVGPDPTQGADLARRVHSLLPDLTPRAGEQVSRVHSAAGLALPTGGLFQRPSFRSPHHSISTVALLGGATSAIAPGEVSLAHRGLLFLEGLADYAPVALDGLRQPLEEGCIRIARADNSVTLPAELQVVATMRPCRCEASTSTACGCSPNARERYLRRISGPLLARFELRVDIEAHPGGPAPWPVESVITVAARVADAVKSRYRYKANAALSADELAQVAALSDEAQGLVEEIMRLGHLTGRGLLGVQRVARTIANLVGDEPPLTDKHMALALALRRGFPRPAST